MEKVRGIGGVFFKSADPEALKRWYQDKLGIEMDDHGYVSFPWRRDDDPARQEMTAWSPFDQATQYFANSDREFMVNFIVDDLDAMLAQLRAGGCEVDDKREDGDFGNFGWVTDPDGTRIELWQPPAPSAKAPGHA